MGRQSRRKNDVGRLVRLGHFGRPERLADLAATGEWYPPQWVRDADEAHQGEWRKLRDGIIKDIPLAVVIDATNVCSYAYNEGFRRVWGDEDYPSLAPPFEACFIEMRSPGRTEDMGTWTGLLPRRFGWLFEAWEAGNVRDHLPHHIGDAPTKPEDVRWVVSMVLVATPDDRGVWGPLSHNIILVAPDGRILGGGKREAPVSCCVPESNIGKLREAMDFFQCLAVPAQLAVSFLNCKNVSLSPVDPDPKLNRERTRVGLKPFVRYHTIDIEPMKKVLRSEGNIESNGLKKSLHICRGHFATYTEDRPLFGRSAGTFWRPSHVRGSVDKGVVVSDYDVKAPNPQASKLDPKE